MKDTAVRWCGSRLDVGEGPRWVDGRLVLVDIMAGALYETDGDRPAPLRRLHRLEVPLGAAAPVAGAPGTWIVAAGRGIALLDRSGELDWLARPAKGGRAPRRMNDGVCDPFGRFWAGCTAWDTTPGAGALFRVDTDGTVTEVLDGLTTPNGPAFSPDGALLYLADSHHRVVYRHPVDPVTGELGERSAFLAFDLGAPDGMTVDVDGNLWVALWGCGEVRQFTPDGVLKAVLTVPVPQVTAPCLGGPGGRRLFVTTAGYGRGDDATDGSGEVFAFDVLTPGASAAAFRPLARGGAGGPG
ncbi:sugar lactone lactonase YvrE [Kitasatospora sp. MAP12-15]|uniref:SMP-30/gluconolactonase/LRE family protein n=1 Tax=unclassified Kitasatospora TaxID=2633591 RepID=UPI0024766742|nr:SMP-30/gluconolactonase/LRE family protein [Kitasatospora sp. MAP12-44]MDH6108188.1 sugar lactone lactonase YvrE [Kitasatospora sp. MAP12-44]